MQDLSTPVRGIRDATRAAIWGLVRGTRNDVASSHSHETAPQAMQQVPSERRSA